ncbi:hypothetical protein JNW92_14580, partial [Lacticaseibacillus paracasei]|nr:hypothetical protein [Lacticaseibacillus paracasei]
HARVADRLPPGMDAQTWGVIRPNLARVADAHIWQQVITGPIAAPEVDAETRAYLDRAAQIAADMAWADDPWGTLTQALKDATGRKGKALFMPLRLALTGHEHGPD